MSRVERRITNRSRPARAAAAPENPARPGGCWFGDPGFGSCRALEVHGAAARQTGNARRPTCGAYLRRAGWLVIVLPLFAGCGSSASEQRAVEAADAGVFELLRSYSAAVEEGRWQDVISLYSEHPDFEWAEDGRIAYTSRAELRSGLEQVASRFSGAETEFRDVVVERLAPGTAHVRAKLNQRFTRPDGTGFGFTVILTAVVVETHGGWQFLKGHTSTVRPR